MKYFFFLFSILLMSSLAQAQPCPRFPCPYINPAALPLSVAFCTDPSEAACFSEGDLSQVIVRYRYWYNDNLKTHQETFTQLADKGYQVFLPRQTDLQYMILDHQITIPALGLSYTLTNIRFKNFREEECSCPRPYISEVTINEEIILLDNYRNILTLTQ